MLALLTGMRSGELRVLGWGDVDVGGGALRVERTLTRDADKRDVGGDHPKTEQSRWTVPFRGPRLDAPIRHGETLVVGCTVVDRLSTAHGDLAVDGGAGGLLRDGDAGAERQVEIVRLALPPLTIRGLRHTSMWRSYCSRAFTRTRSPI